MSETHAPTGSRQEPGGYEIRLKGHLDHRWAARFDGLSLSHEADGITTLRGPLVDQAALHGVLQLIRDLGLPLISVTRVEPDQATTPASSPTAPRLAELDETHRHETDIKLGEPL